MGVSRPNEHNLLSLEQQCRYKYLAYAEGMSYSGRLKYFMMCNSTIVIPPFVFVEWFAPLLKVRARACPTK